MGREIPLAESSIMGLLPQHEALVRASKISNEVAAARGYFSATRKDELETLGFQPYQQLVPALVIPIRNVHGEIAQYQIRPDRPRVTDGGKELKYENPQGARLVIDVPLATRSKLCDPKIPLWITEGARKVDAAVSAGLCCIGLSGVWGWRGTNEHGGKTALACWDSIALNNRTVFIAFDSDVMTKEAVQLAVMALRKYLKNKEAKVTLVDLPCGEHEEKVGLDDFLAAGHTIDELMACVRDPKKAATTSESRKEDSQAKKILSIAGASDVELFHDAEPRPYISFPVGQHRETHPLESRAVRQWLAFKFYKAHSSAPSPEAVNMARLTFEGQALFEGDRREVSLRVSHDRGAVVVDLADDDWRVVRIDAAGWNILSTSPVKFRRSAGMLPLPVPKREGSLDDLRPFVNVASDDDFVLLISWLIGAIRPRGPYTLLCLSGEQGSAKSTVMRVLRRLIDPNKSDVRAEPKNKEDLAVAANNGHVVAFDNLSAMAPWLSDALCRLSTGGGFATRQLYTNAEECIFDAQRPSMVNGINEVASRPDLLDRSILLSLPRISETSYRTERTFWATFEQARPRILGALFDAVSMALRRESEIELAQPTRMADFATWVCAAEEALPWKQGQFLGAYMANRASANELALEASVIAGEVQKFTEAVGSWEGTCKDLLCELDQRADERTRTLDSWPKTPRGLGAALRRIAPNLRATGIEIEIGGKSGRGKDRHRLVRLSIPAEPSPSSPRTDRTEDIQSTGGYELTAGDGRGDDGDGGDGNARRSETQGAQESGDTPRGEWVDL